jgi:hypothetical protein
MELVTENQVPKLDYLIMKLIQHVLNLSLLIRLKITSNIFNHFTNIV